jgi:FtsH-binding integral membrane protein
MSNYRPQGLDYESFDPQASASMAPEASRNSFIRKTYLHVAGAILALIAIDAAIFAAVPRQTLLELTQAVSGWMWLVVLAGLMGVSYVANMMAANRTSVAAQYAGLGLYTVAMAVLLVPLLFVANELFGGGIIIQAALATLILVSALTAFVFISGYDFSFLRGILMIAGFAAMAAIVGAVLFSLPLFGVVFSSLMIALAGGYILYETSNVSKHYPVDMHVAASLALFSSIVTMFWYVLQLLMSLRGDD